MDEPAEFKPSKRYDFRFTRKQLEMMKHVFDLFDDDFDGIIKINHLGSAIRACGYPLSEKALEETIREFDPLSTGTIDLASFFRIMALKYRDAGDLLKQTDNSFFKIGMDTPKGKVYNEKEDLVLFHPLHIHLSHYVFLPHHPPTPFIHNRKYNWKFSKA